VLGAAGVHIHEMVAERNFAPGNAGVIFYTDVLVPLIGLCFCGCNTEAKARSRQRAVVINDERRVVVFR
jgi:hypothetical protein